jgi:hypothetical protein
MEKIDLYKSMPERKWREGACSGTVYGANEALEDLNVTVYKKFMWANVLHGDVFPDVRKMVLSHFLIELYFTKLTFKIFNKCFKEAEVVS